MNKLMMVAFVWIAAVVMRVASAAQLESAAPAAQDGVQFATANTCMACHNGLTTAGGEDISIGTDWRGSIMANSSRDPYWQAAVRRETIDHPKAASEIEDQCAICHMPMSRAQAAASGRKGQIFRHLPVTGRIDEEALLAHDGVSCTLCHQISHQKLGTPESFTGRFVVNESAGNTARAVFGPFAIDKGRMRIMQSATGFEPTEASHMRRSEICATCHTLYTKALGPDGETIGTLPEQVPYLEWLQSSFPGEQRSCQTCHMPIVREETPISSVLGTPRTGVARHGFRGGNFFMLRMLNRYRDDLGVKALPQELAASGRSTLEQLQTETASLSIERAVVTAGRLEIDVTVRNLAGHKLPTGYPSRRAWIDLAVVDRNGRELFRSGAVSESGAISGNDNDADPMRHEPHYSEIREPDQVQIYESMIVDRAGAITTGLLKGLRYVKDNRLLPRGFDKATAHADVRVIGEAADDESFVGGGDRIRYSVAVANAPGPLSIDVRLRFQPIGFRWAQNLKSYDSEETRRFVSFYESMSAAATEVLARATATTE